MSINWNVSLWNIGIFNKMDQIQVRDLTLLTKTSHVLALLFFLLRTPGYLVTFQFDLSRENFKTFKQDTILFIWKFDEEERKKKELIFYLKNSSLARIYWIFSYWTTSMAVFVLSGGFLAFSLLLFTIWDFFGIWVFYILTSSRLRGCMLLSARDAPFHPYPPYTLIGFLKITRRGAVLFSPVVRIPATSFHDGTSRNVKR